MIVYQTNVDGTLAGAIELNNTDKCPITGAWLIPGGCVETAPPVEKEGFERAWQNDAWQYVEIPKEPEPEPPTLDELKAAKLREIDSWTAQHITAGFVSASTGTTATYDSEKEDQQNIMLMLQAALSADFTTHPVYQGHVPIRAIPDGQTAKVILQHDAAQMQALVNDMALHIGACKQTGWDMQAAVAAATAKEELVLIVWPE